MRWARQFLAKIRMRDADQRLRPLGHRFALQVHFPILGHHIHHVARMVVTMFTSVRLNTIRLRRSLFLSWVEVRQMKDFPPSDA